MGRLPLELPRGTAAFKLHICRIKTGGGSWRSAAAGTGAAVSVQGSVQDQVSRVVALARWVLVDPVNDRTVGGGGIPWPLLVRSDVVATGLDPHSDMKLRKGAKRSVVNDFEGISGGRADLDFKVVVPAVVGIKARQLSFDVSPFQSLIGGSGFPLHHLGVIHREGLAMVQAGGRSGIGHGCQHQHRAGEQDRDGKVLHSEFPFPEELVQDGAVPKGFRFRGACFYTASLFEVFKPGI